MKSVECPSCGAKMKRNGKTSAGRQRWRCPSCGASSTVRRDGDAAALREFLGWLMSKGSQRDMPGQGRSFRRRTARFWELWPMPVADGEWHRVLYVDGIWLARDLVVLICRSDERVVSWYMARSKTSRAWSALMGPIPASDVVVFDGGTGFASAVRRSWSGTRAQRCVFHAFCQVRRYTTSGPRLQAGVELYGLAGDLLRIGTLHQAELWVERYLQWCGIWADFLEDTSVIDGRRVFTHERLRRARSSLSRLVSEGTLFTYLDPELTEAGPLPSTNNAAESLNARLREMLRNHRGMSLMRRVKAVFWWCHMHSGDSRTAAEKLVTMPTSTFSTGPAQPPRSATTARSGETGPCGRSSTTGTCLPWWLDWPTGAPVPSGHTFCPITRHSRRKESPRFLLLGKRGLGLAGLCLPMRGFSYARSDSIFS